MNKLYTVLFFLAGIFEPAIIFAQAPVLSYPTPQVFAVNQPITPIPITNTGGAVPPGYYANSSTIGGDGYYGYTDGNVSNARFANPVGIARDPSGNIYIADANNNAIRKLAPDGAVTTFAGGGAAGSADGTGTAAHFNYPTGVASDANGYIYVADFSNNRIRKIFPNGEVITIASTGFSLPYSLAVDAAGNVIVADSYNNLIKKIDINGVVTTIAGNSASTALTDGHGTAASFNLPYGVVLDKVGNIYVADRNNNAIRKITPTGDVSTLVHNTNVYLPTGITIDSLGTLYVTNGVGFISKINPNTGESTVFAGADVAHDDGVTFKEGVDTAARFSGNAGIGYDPGGQLIIADSRNFVVRQFSLIGYQVPPLPHYLEIDTLGTLSGTPYALSAAQDYTITAYTLTTSSSAVINIAIANTAPQTITFNPIADKTYGNADLENAATSSNPTIPITYTSSDLTVATIVDNKIHIVSAGITNITANQAGNASFTAAAPVTRPLTIKKATATIIANDQVKIQGQVNPPFTFHYSGFINNDDSTLLITQPTALTTATTSSTAGSYPITPSGATAKNYQFNYTPGTLVVSALPAIVANGPLAFLAGDSVLLSVNLPAGYTYQWNYAGNPIAGAVYSTYKAIISGSYTVSVTANGQTAVSAAVTVTAAFTLPPQNFKLQINAVTCKGSNNGTVTITAVKNLSYIASVTDANNVSTTYPFTTNLVVGNLKPGTYGVCIAVNGQLYQQCFSVTITEPKDLSVYSVVNQTQNTINLQLDGGDIYNVNLNGTIYTTSQNQITLPLVAGENKIAITTDKLCQGVVERSVTIKDYIPYPNPFTDVLSLNLGNTNVKQMQVNIYNVVTGKQVYKNHYVNQSGVMQLDVRNLNAGVYYLNLILDNKVSSFKILKK